MKAIDKLVGIFSKIDDIKPISIGVPADVLDDTFLGLYGQKELSVYAEGKEVDTIAKELAYMFVDKWNRIFNLEYAEKVNYGGYSETITETIKDDGANGNDETETEINKVSAFNDDDFVNKDNATTERKNTGTTTNNRTREYTRQGYNDNQTEKIKNYLDLLQDNLINDIIYRDVSRVTLSRIVSTC